MSGGVEGAGEGAQREMEDRTEAELRIAVSRRAALMDGRGGVPSGAVADSVMPTQPGRGRSVRGRASSQGGPNSGPSPELAPLMRELGRIVREATRRVESGRSIEAASSLMAVPMLHAAIIELLAAAMAMKGLEGPGETGGSLIGQYL